MEDMQGNASLVATELKIAPTMFHMAGFVLK